ncbi:hypothetical protein AMECASPLE_014365 [Ameca splendens]|uniref:Uncharacterized protein n=1 Tax=Ameca splendens TaxID=208324 RepID=A0ABV0Y1H2_9TELE
MFLDCGRKPEYLVRSHACRKTLRWESNPGPSCRKAKVLPTAPLCSFKSTFHQRELYFSLKYADSIGKFHFILFICIALLNQSAFTTDIKGKTSNNQQKNKNKTIGMLE